MGWTSYHANYYKKGTVDRKRECDAYFMEGLNEGHYSVLKSAMVGSTYYAAVKEMVKYVGRDENNEPIYEPHEGKIFGVVFLTSTDMKDYFNFSYKDMDETCGPYESDCPKGILDLLSPTENEFALQWRTRCYENLAKKKNKDSLNKLPVGSVIKVTMPFDTRFFYEGDEIKLEKRENWGSNRTYWGTTGIKFTAGLMKQLDGYYEIVKRGGEQ